MGSAEEERCAAALAALDIGPARLRRLLQDRRPTTAWQALERGAHPEDPDGRAMGMLGPELLERVGRAVAAAGTSVFVLGADGYPSSLATDDEAPAVLFVRGDAGVLDGRPRVAVVGTRSASAAGLEVAHEMGRTLAEAGVVVVSGLATGIDSAALTGALDASGGAAPVTVLGTSHDGRATPAQRSLQMRIAERGAVLSEQAPGSHGARWRFAARNRIMAALAHLVVVVECHVEGGALHTVRAARRRAVPVAAVPGSVHQAASAGANALLVEGAACVRHGSDVLGLLATSCDPSLVSALRRLGRTSRGRMVDGLDAESATVLAALGPDPLELGRLVDRCDLPFGVVARSLGQLRDLGLAESAGGWWRRIGSAGGRR